jgi:hypothetical protein
LYTQRDAIGAGGRLRDGFRETQIIKYSGAITSIQRQIVDETIKKAEAR